MTSNLWKLDRTSIPESMECSDTALIFSLTKYTQPWERINTVEGILQQCGIAPFAEVLDVPKSGILGQDIPESARKPHPNLLFRALAIQALGKVREGIISSEEPVSSDFSENKLAVLEQEALGGSTPLIRWCAAVSIQSILLDEWQAQGKESAGHVTINAAEIEQRVVEEQIKLLASNKFALNDNSRMDSGKEYENCLDFWVYGPSWLLLGVSMDCEEYLFWVDRVFPAIAITDNGYKFHAEKDAAITNFLDVAKNNFKEWEFSQIVAKVFEFLHHPEAAIKNRAAIILEPYQDRLDRKSAQIMTALLYKFHVEHQSLESLTIPEIEECKASLYLGKKEIDGVYSDAVSLCGDDVAMANFLSEKQREYQNTVDEHINNLSKLVKSILDCQSLLDANRELLYLTVERLQEWDQTLGNKLAGHRNKLQNVSVDKSTSEQCINLDNDLNLIRDSLQSTLYEVTSKINSKIRDLELSASKNNKTATQMFKWTWLLLGVWFSIGLVLYLSDAVINSILTVNYYQSEFLVYWTMFFIVMVVFLLVLAIFFATLAALDKRRESKLIPKFDSLSQIGNSFSILWQKSYLQQFVPSVRSN
ncbi:MULTISPECIES: hypothetical protein [unclassified Microcoleus]|uniref:hypothetical protein n=1 Tax=unclassified Microcoleus TaxID=2642155 RepID=UPI0025D124A3|nr:MULTISPECIES: hypothetical protein [unclassified Microcoleus]